MVSLCLSLSLLWPTSSPTVPTNCVGLVGEFVHFNKIMPAGEHMAVQNFITPFMAFQRYDDRGRGVAGANRKSERVEGEEEVDERPDERAFSLVPKATRPCANIY